LPVRDDHSGGFYNCSRPTQFLSTPDFYSAGHECYAARQNLLYGHPSVPWFFTVLILQLDEVNEVGFLKADTKAAWVGEGLTAEILAIPSEEI
jgi:hypothetical protein